MILNIEHPRIMTALRQLEGASVYVVWNNGEETSGKLFTKHPFLVCVGDVPWRSVNELKEVRVA